MNDLFSVESPTLREALFLLKREIGLREQKRKSSLTLLRLRAEESAAVLLRDCEGEPAEGTLLPERLRENYHLFLGALPPDASGELKPLLCRALAEQLEKQASPYLALPDKLPEGIRVCYVRNRFSDAAYDLLSALLPAPVARYADHFDGAAEMLANEECDAILLPYQTAEGGTLRGVEGILSAYDYKKTLVAVLKEGTSFALLQTGLHSLPGADRMEMEIHDGSGEILQEVIAVCLAGGGKLLGVTLREGGSFKLLMEVSPRQQLVLRLYFDLHHPHATCGGIFRIEGS